MAQLKDTIIAGSLRVTDTIFSTNLNLSSLTADYAVLTDSSKNLISRGITNNTSATAVTASTNLITANTLYYHKGNSNIVTVGTITSGEWKSTTAAIGTAYGGTGNTSFTQWGIIYANPATKLVSTAAGTDGYILIGKGSAAPAWQEILPTSHGGTGTKTAPTQWGVIYASTTSAYASTGAGTAGYLLQSNASSAPTWIQATNANTASTIVKRDASGNFSAGTITATLSGNASTATKVLDAGDTTKSLSIRYYGDGASATDWIPMHDSNGNLVPVSSTNLANKVRDKASGSWGISVTGSSGSCTGNADTATKATKDSDGNTIKSTYLKLAGGTMTGELYYNTGTATTNREVYRAYNNSDSSAWWFILRNNTPGTTSSEGYTDLLIGNGKTSTTAWNSTARLWIYNGNGGYCTILGKYGAINGTNRDYIQMAYISCTQIAGTLIGNCTGSSSSCTGNAATATTASSVWGESVNHGASFWGDQGTGEHDVGVNYGTGLLYFYGNSTNGASGIQDSLGGHVLLRDTSTNGYTFYGTFSGNATTASAITDITSNDAAASSSTYRYVWISYANNTTGRPAYDTDFAYRSDIKSLKLKQWYLIPYGGAYGTGGEAYIWLNGSSGVTQSGESASRVRCGKDFQASKVYGAVWNDYAEYRHGNSTDPGYCYTETNEGIMIKTKERLMPGCKLSSDTYGFAIGQTEQSRTPIAVSGRVLVYPYRAREEYHLGDALCSAPGGTVDIMTREEIMMYPERIVATVSEIPDYDTWRAGEYKEQTSIDVNGRIWVYVK